MADKKQTATARRLRRNMTPAETLLWSRLRGQQCGVKFVRQLPIGPYIADFACRSARLVIELDGGQHASSGTRDDERTHLIDAHGYRVMRFWNDAVIDNLDGVLDAIVAQLTIARGG